MCVHDHDGSVIERLLLRFVLLLLLSLSLSLLLSFVIVIVVVVVVVNKKSCCVFMIMTDEAGL